MSMEDYNFQKAREAWGDGNNTAKPGAIQHDKDGNEMAHGRFDLPAPKQEPYGYFRYDIKLDAWVQDKESTQGVSFYTTPPNREWVGLTHIEIGNLWAESQEVYSFAKVIEAKLKEKNT